LTSRVFSFRWLRLEVHSHAPAPLDWLDEFFASTFGREADGERADCDLVLTLDPKQVARIARETPTEEPGPIDTFTLDGRFERLALWSDTARMRLLHDTRAHAFVRLEPRARAIEVVAERDHRHVRVLLMRIVRELGSLHALERGDVCLHAASAVQDGTAILIAGAKRAGKTTLLLDVIRRGGGAHLSSDRVMIDAAGDAPIAYGVPTIASVRDGSRAVLHGLASPPSQYRHYATLEECATDGHPIVEPTSRTIPPMSPSQFRAWLGATAASDAPVSAIVFPRIDEAVETLTLQALSPADAAERLRAVVFRSGREVSIPDAFAAFQARAASLETGSDTACRRLAARVPTYECRLGPRAFIDAPVLTSLIASRNTKSEVRSTK
jgi:hypothetical protein